MSSTTPFNPSGPVAAGPANPPGISRAPVPAATVRPGTFAPGTKVQVGGQKVVIEKYLSEGGFAHVYVVRVPRGEKFEVAVLKRVAVPDKEALANMRTEVETMKKLKGHRHIVTYIDSHASQLKGGGYEVFLLMEYCAGGGLIDFMNTRLQYRLTEAEILHIFSDVAEGVACMHYLKPPLLHRDLKVENVLISTSGSSRIYKLCDFGSAASPRPAAKTAAEGRLIEDDVQRHTTLQYRSPEMVDVYRKQAIDEKSDIWALGVLLYKLCYYTTPFEDQGQMAILNASFKYPTYPAFSDRTKKLIAWMLRENPQSRPNIYQALSEVCSMRGTEVPVKDIYTRRTESESRRNQQLPKSEPNATSSPPVGLHKSAPLVKTVDIPEIAPMRRGRPTASIQPTSAAKSSPSPGRGTMNDPFAALDSQSASVRAAAADELSARFPSLDEFSLLHDRGAKFQFEPPPATDPSQDNLNQRVTEALADEAFARPSTSPIEPISRAPEANPTSLFSKSSVSNSQRQPPQISPLIHQPTPQKPKMVSTGTMTSSSPAPQPKSGYRSTNRLTGRASSKDRSSSLPRVSESNRGRAALTASPPFSLTIRPALRESHRSKSHSSTIPLPQSPASSRPSLEGQRPPALDLGDHISRSKSAEIRGRPTSLYVDSSREYLKERESSNVRSSAALGIQNESLQPTPITGGDETTISSDMEFLRAIEGDESAKRKHHRRHSGYRQSKRSSLPSMSLSGTKNILAGKFGEAFRRFENNTATHDSRSRSPLGGGHDPQLLPPPRSDAPVDDEIAIDDSESLAPEVRRELERRRLSQEEKRVADAAAEYRRRIAAQGEGSRGASGLTRASTIQNRVKSLLDDSKSTGPTAHTAEGYGHFANSRKLPHQQQQQNRIVEASARGPKLASDQPNTIAPKALSIPTSKFASLDQSAQPTPRLPIRPNAPPKPKALRTGGQQATLPSLAGAKSSLSEPTLNSKISPLQSTNMSTSASPSGEDWEAKFTKRYPSLSGLELVETDVGMAGSVGLVGSGARVKGKDL